MHRVRVCFVCTGNICRSPTAHGVMRAVVERAGLGDRVEVDSAGVSGYHVGELPDPRSRRAAAARGLRLEHRARLIAPADFLRFDYLLAMDGGHKRALERLAPSGARASIVLFRDFDASAGSDRDVPDPYYGGEAGFDEVLDMCERACEGLLQHLVVHHELGS